MSAQALTDPFGIVGTVLDGQYRVDAVVGEGGFGVVYRGWHASLDQPIAVKALKMVDAEDARVKDALLAKFRDEAKILYTLSQASLHVVRSIDFGVVNAPSGLWAPYMVLEWLEGRSLAQDLDARRRQGLGGRTLEEALAILEPAAEGLGVAHQRRIAHRDFKPGNLFLLDATTGPRVKVLDFGIAKIVRDGEGGGTKSAFSSFTWAYAAPEQLDPRIGATGLETDVYAFALVLTELLTGRPPVDGRDVVTFIRAATDPTSRPTPRGRGANVPDEIELACRRALAVDPRARFPNIGELWAALAAGRRAGAVSTRAMHAAPPASALASARPAPAPGHSGAPAPQASQVRAPAPSAPQWTPPPVAPPHTAPRSQQAGPPFMTPRPLAPPAAFAPPAHPPTTGRLRPAPIPTGGSQAVVIVAVVGFVLALLLAGSCAALHAAC